MTLSITSGPPPVAAAPPSTQQLSQLNQLVAKYKVQASRNAPAQSLAALARQISVMSTSMGQHVTLPRVSGAPAAPPPPRAATAANDKLNVTA